jgi:hypothetical protein
LFNGCVQALPAMVVRSFSARRMRLGRTMAEPLKERGLSGIGFQARRFSPSENIHVKSSSSETVMYITDNIL